MRYALRSYKGIKLKRINAVRLYLQAFFNSDITNSDRQTIAREFLYASDTKNRFYYSNLIWPTQEYLGIAAWKQLREFIGKPIFNFSFPLHQLLGAWIPNNFSTQSWESRIDPVTKKFYLCINGNWVTYNTSNKSRRVLEEGNST